ncbi:Reverse transcriptase [Theobroma cacao]|nr:Reverse transcriptase [Theobroma cacao]
MDSIMDNKTWKLVDHPLGFKLIGCKWIFKKKTNVGRTIDKFKARLVAKSFTQKLKQAPKPWHLKSDEIVLANGYKINKFDKYGYSKFNNGKGFIICIHVDDILTDAS